MFNYKAACKAEGLNPKYPLQEALESLRLEIEGATSEASGGHLCLSYVREKITILDRWFALMERRAEREREVTA